MSIPRLIVTVLTVAALLLTAFVFVGSWSPVKEAKKPPQDYQLTRVKCAFSVYFDGAIECAQLRLPTPDADIVLPVTVIKGSGHQAPGYSATALLYFSGGPGAGVAVDDESIHHWLGWYEQAGLQRDLVLFDRRATGYSNHRHQCLSYDRFSLSVLTKNLTVSDELQQGLAVIESCFSRFKKKSNLPSKLGSTTSSDDALALMRALNYSRWHIFGVSYGSRLALVHADAHPNFVEKVILDSVYPLGRGVLEAWPHLLNGALSRYFSYCKKTPHCNDALSGEDPERTFWRAMASLQASPLQLKLVRWQGGEIKLLLNDQRFLAALFSALYDVHSIEKIAPAIDAVLSGSGEAVEQLLTPFVNYALDDSFNPWAYWSIECAENTASKNAFMAAQASYPKLAPYLEGVYEYDVCRQLRAAGAVEPTKMQTQKIALAQQVLILAGKLDPITPSDWAKELHQKSVRSQFWLLPNTGHSVAANSLCVHAQLEGFLASGSAWQPQKLCSGTLIPYIKKAP